MEELMELCNIRYFFNDEYLFTMYAGKLTEKGF